MTKDATIALVIGLAGSAGIALLVYRKQRADAAAALAAQTATSQYNAPLVLSNAPTGYSGTAAKGTVPPATQSSNGFNVGAMIVPPSKGPKFEAASGRLHF